jgi:hypothetical protein
VHTVCFSLVEVKIVSWLSIEVNNFPISRDLLPLAR